MQASRFLRTVSKAFHSASRENAMGIGAGAGAGADVDADMLHVAVSSRAVRGVKHTHACGGEL